MLKIKADDKYFVYEHLFPNGKRYIGITTNPKRRWANGLGYNHNIYMKRAITKYGWNNIKHNILFTDKTKEEAEILECELIALYQSNKAQYGYNIDNGGNSIGKHSEQTLQKIREYASNRPKSHNENISKAKKGKPLNLSFEQRLAISKRFKGNHYGLNSKSMLGKHHTQDAKDKISKANTGNTSWNKGKKLSLEHIQKSSLKHQKPVVQYDKDMNFIREYPSIKIAFEITHINNIGKCCRNIQQTSGGYIWKYKIKANIVEKVVEDE